MPCRSDLKKKDKVNFIRGYVLQDKMFHKEKVCVSSLVCFVGEIVLWKKWSEGKKGKTMTNGIF